MQHPAMLAVLLVAAAYVARQWRADQRAARAGHGLPHAFPGATDAPPRAIGYAVAGALALVGIETAGEFAWGISAEQSRVTWLFAAYSIGGAPVLEELVFRGYVVVANRGRAALWASVLTASLAFALLHPFLWRWDENGFAFTFTRKTAFSTAMAFVASLWLYGARFAPWNPRRSLSPCFAAHAAKNAAVIAVKAASGFVSGAW